MKTIRLTSRFMRPDDVDVIASVQKKLEAAGLERVKDIDMVNKIQAVRRSVESIRAADEAFNQEPEKIAS